MRTAGVAFGAEFTWEDYMISREAYETTLPEPLQQVVDELLTTTICDMEFENGERTMYFLGMYAGHVHEDDDPSRFCDPHEIQLMQTDVVLLPAIVQRDLMRQARTELMTWRDQIHDALLEMDADTVADVDEWLTLCDQYLQDCLKMMFTTAGDDAIGSGWRWMVVQSFYD